MTTTDGEDRPLRHELKAVHAAVAIDRGNAVVAIISSTDDVVSACGFASRAEVDQLIADLRVACDAVWPLVR